MSGYDDEAGQAIARHSTIRVVTGLRAATQSLVWVGMKAGIFERHGLSVTFPKLEVGGPEAVAGLIRGDWDYAQTGTVPVAEAALRGEDAVVILRTSADQGYVLIAANRDITNLEQLDGEKVGVLVNTCAGQTGILVRLALERVGAIATYAPLGTYWNIYQALKAGEIAAGALPVDYRLFGYSHHWNWFETPALGLPEILATTRRKISNDRDEVLAVLQGCIETISFIKSRSAPASSLLQEFLNIADDRAVERIRRTYVSSLPDVPLPELHRGMPTLRNIFARRYPGADRLQAEDVADLSLLNELAVGA